MSALWMLVAAVLFSVMGLMVKLAGKQYGIAEIVFYRSLIGVVSLYAFVRWRGAKLATPVAFTHLSRGTVGIAALALWFYATNHLPLGTALTLNYTSPLFLAVFIVSAAAAASQPIEWRLVAAVLVGFLGVLLLLKPSFASDEQTAALAGLISGVLSAVAYWYVRRLGKLGEPEWRTVFYFTLSGTVLGLLGSIISGFAPHDARGLALLVGIGITATFAQLAMTRAYAFGHTLVVANLQYVAVVIASILGIAIFDDHIPWVGWLGMAIIIASSAAATILVARGHSLTAATATSAPNQQDRTR